MPGISRRFGYEDRVRDLQAPLLYLCVLGFGACGELVEVPAA
jgi:hypothetical protein